MICDKCSIPMYIKSGKNVVKNGNTPDLPTELYYVQVAECPKCKKTQVIENKQPIEEN